MPHLHTFCGLKSEQEAIFLNLLSEPWVMQLHSSAFSNASFAASSSSGLLLLKLLLYSQKGQRYQLVRWVKGPCKYEWWEERPQEEETVQQPKCEPFARIIMSSKDYQLLVPILGHEEKRRHQREGRLNKRTIGHMLKLPSFCKTVSLMESCGGRVIKAFFFFFLSLT